MRGSYDVMFVSSNRHKFGEVRPILNTFGIRAGFAKRVLPEIQSGKLEKIAAHKAQRAFELYQSPVLTEDDGLFIDALGGFPGPYSSFVFDTIGNGGVLKLLGSRRSASFRAVIAYCDSGRVKIFDGTVPGTISWRPRGRGWGYDPIFIPKNSSKTFAQGQKNLASHRYIALTKLAIWLKRTG